MGVYGESADAMEEISPEKKELNAGIQRRLNRIAGQIKGIQRMLDQKTYCMDVLVQIAAVRAAISKVGVMIIENHVKECLAEALTGENKEEKLDELVAVLNNFIK